MQKPRTFTAAEEVIGYLSERIISDGRSYKTIALGVRCAPSTIANIASGTTKWPRPNTLFGLMLYFNIKMRLE